MGSAASAFQWCGPGPRIPYGPAVYDLAATEAGHMAAPDHAQQSALRFFLHRRGRPHMPCGDIVVMDEECNEVPRGQSGEIGSAARWSCPDTGTTRTRLS